ncbi:MAG: ATP-binding protein, partial [Cyclobacteriaceae bacterium]
VFTSAVGIVKDITDHYTHLEDLRIAKEQAESASKAKSEFLANMSHEIRTPLNGVVGFSDLLVRTDLSDKQKKYTSVINQSANSLMVIVDSILDLSKVEAGKLELLEDKAELSSIATQVIELVSYKIQDEKLKIFLTAAPEIYNSFYVDEAKVRQVLTILISNSIKFTEHGEIELRIESLGKPDDGRVPIRFSVRDTGIGIDPAHHLKIFEAFSQGNSSTTKRYGGTGLGLTIANSLLALMDSRLQMESQVGKGSLFYFDLSLRLASND